MLIYSAICISVGVYLILNSGSLHKIAGCSLIGYGANLFLLTCTVVKSPLIQSLVLTAIVVGIGMISLFLNTEE